MFRYFICFDLNICFYFGLIMLLVPIFVAKSQFAPFIFFISIWFLFWEIWSYHVSVSRFFEFFFWIFFYFF